MLRTIKRFLLWLGSVALGVVLLKPPSPIKVPPSP